jgi:hypothetical protein
MENLTHVQVMQLKAEGKIRLFNAGVNLPDGEYQATLLDSFKVITFEKEGKEYQLVLGQVQSASGKQIEIPVDPNKHLVGMTLTFRVEDGRAKQVKALKPANGTPIAAAAPATAGGF